MIQLNEEAVNVKLMITFIMLENLCSGLLESTSAGNNKQN